MRATHQGGYIVVESVTVKEADVVTVGGGGRPRLRGKTCWNWAVREEKDGGGEIGRLPR